MNKRHQPGMTAAIFVAALGLVTLATCGQTAQSSGKQCDSKQCFEAQFADCEPATYASGEMAGARVQYQIDGPVDSGCKITFVFLKNPNPEWANKPLHMVFDSDKPFGPQAKDAIGQCLSNAAPMDYQCSGPLRGARTWPSAREGDGPIPENEAENEPGGETSRSGAPAKPQAVTEPPCGETVEVSGEPLYAMPRNGKWGYVNRAGDWVIEPQWRQAEPFSEGRAAVNTGSDRPNSSDLRNKWGIIDRSGQYVVAPSIKPVETGDLPVRSPIKPFSQGCAAVEPDKNDQKIPYFVSRDGRVWARDGLPPALSDWEVKEYGSFSQGLAWFKVKPSLFTDATYGWLDTQGQVAIKPTFAAGGDFVGGRAPAAINKKHWGYIDKHGELVWPGKWTLRRADAFAEGMAGVQLKGDKVAYTDGEGWDSLIHEIRFDAPRTLGTGDNQETVDSAPMAPTSVFSESLGVFADGLAPVKALPDKDLFYMNPEGEAVLAPDDNPSITVCWQNTQHRTPPRFRHGLVRLLVADKGESCNGTRKIGNYHTYKHAYYVYMDPKGQIVLEEPFREGDTDALPSRREDDS